MRSLLLLAGMVVSLFALPSGSCAAQGPPKSPDRMAWWRDARFGLFIHWGLYAVPAGTWNDRTDHAEWIRHTAQIPIDEYDTLRKRWNPVRFDAAAWAKLARQAGMRYVVITTKHHDGFCLFDSKLTDFDVMSTPFGRDVMQELADACRKEGLRICWYHSIMDWHHPDYLPRRPWEQRAAGGARFERYVAYLHGQVEELLTSYGEIGVMWFDGEWEATWTHEHGVALDDLCRRLQPSIIVNNRVDKGRAGMAGMTTEARFRGDFGTPEQEIPATGLPGVDWETCMTMNRHWGYNAHDDHWKSARDLIRKLVDVASKGGNFLLNVGPTAEGLFPKPCVERLVAIGNWMEVNGEAIHGTSASPFQELTFGRCTMKEVGDGTRLYLHVFEWPQDGVLRVPGLGNEVTGAFLLARPDEALRATRGRGTLEITVPREAPDPAASVVVLDVKGRPVVFRTPVIAAPSEVFVKALDIPVPGGSPGLLIRYTGDGSDPTAASPVWKEPLRITEDTVLKARSFFGERPVGMVAEATFRKVAPHPPVTVEHPAPGLLCARFQGTWDRLPDFDVLDPLSTTTVPAVALPKGPAEERLGLRFTGYLLVPDDDVWLFSLTSDDGARLWIGDRLVADNDGLHGPEERRGAMALGAGLHPLRVEWFNKTGGATLDLRYAPVGKDPTPIPPAALRQ